MPGMLWHWGQRSAPDTDPCLHGPSSGRMPWSMSKSHRSWRPEPAPPLTWPYYYLTLMTLMVAFILVPLVEANSRRQLLRVTAGCSQCLLTWSFWAEIHATFESKLISSPGGSPALLKVVLEKLEDQRPIINHISFLTQRPLKHLLLVLNYDWMIFFPLTV